MADLKDWLNSINLNKQDITAEDPQLTIPLRVEETECPKLGVVISSQSDNGAYLRIYCDGSAWSVKSDSVYAIKG